MKSNRTQHVISSPVANGWRSVVQPFRYSDMPRPEHRLDFRITIRSFFLNQLRKHQRCGLAFYIVISVVPQECLTRETS